ncbi:MAG: PAS domain-containing protein [Desulfarculaceae bacterium]|nr:PAS domain-containing protein [Desulfarculaceae bacterium]
MAKDQEKKSASPKNQEKPAEAGLESQGKEAEDRGGEGLVVVGIGASAGGLEALRQLLPGLPADQPVAYVIVQHLDPKHRSMLVNLLASHTHMEVLAVEDGETLKRGKVYITPPGHDLVMRGNKLVMRELSNGVGPRPSVDMFLTSLAEQRGEKAVGIILSGTGSDGAHGMRAVKGGGGITIVQTPDTAKYDGMPRAAMDTGNVDLVLPAEKIGPELASIFSSPLLTPEKQPELREPDAMGQLLTMIRVRTGCDFSEYKEKTIHRRVGRRVVLHKLANLREYIDFAEKHPEDLDALAKDILISVTSFFRDREAFQALEKILDKILAKKKKGDPVRFWVPACASGEEAYSIAMLLALRLGNDFEHGNVQIFGTDMDGDAIAQARRGLYPEASLVDVDPKLVDRFFRRRDNLLQINKSIRERIVFARQDLTKDPPFSRLDLISCRNLLIYLNNDLQRRIIPLFHYALNPDGYLFLGKSESIGHFGDLFETVSKKWRIFRRKGSMRTPMLMLRSTQRAGEQPAQLLKPTKPEVPLRQIAYRALAETMGTPAVIIDERWEVVHVLGDVKPFLHLADGDAGLNVIDLASDQVRVSLRAAVHKAMREQVKVTSARVPWHMPGNGNDLLDLTVSPIRQEDVPSGLFLVAFERREQPGVGEIGEGGIGDARDQRIVDLEQELAANREHLQTTTEELETSNEELQSLNEELQSANEELQSTNEELETSNEELQATNEELTTVNEELQVKSAELGSANNDLENILTHMGLPLIVVDRELRIRRFTPPTSSLFNLMAGNRGQVLTTVGSQLELPDLAANLKKVIDEGDPLDMVVKGGMRYFEMKAFPYVEEDGGIHGAIITFYDQTESNRREQEFRALAENSPDIVVRFDKQLRHIYVNQGVVKYTGRTREEFHLKTNRELGMPKELCDIWDEALRNVFARGEEALSRFKFTTPDGERYFQSRMVPEFTPDGNVATVLAVSRDVTGLVLAEEEAKQNARQLEEILESINDGFMVLDQGLSVRYFNSMAGAILDRKGRDVLDVPLLEAFPEFKGSVLVEKFEQALAEGRALEFETFFDREPYVNWYMVRIYPYQEGISVFFQVITEAKEIEQERKIMEDRLRQAQKMEAIGTLAGGVAHDFNNILAAIKGYGELALRDNQAGKPNIKDLETVLEATNRAADLVNSILTFSRKKEPRYLSLDLNQQVRQAVGILERTIPRMIDIELNLAEDLPSLYGDPSQLQQIVLNLGSNARDAMPQGGKLTIETSQVSLGEDYCQDHPEAMVGDFLLLKVSDNGIGMNPEVLSQIYDPFFTTKEVGSGTGLGLSTVYGIARAHGGYVHCETAPGQGASFGVYLPLDQDGEQPSRESGAADGQQVMGGDETILVVDDEPQLRHLAERMLGEAGYRVLKASTGEEAVEMAAQPGQEPDLVLLDINMPGMGGMTSIEKLRAIHPDTKIVMISGHAQEKVFRSCLAQGATDYIDKPFTRVMLLAKVRQTLDS